MEQKDFDFRYSQKLKEYKDKFDATDSTPNDMALLDILIKNELMLEGVQESIRAMLQEDPVGLSMEIKKLSDLSLATTNTILSIQKTLGIDRKTRRAEESGTVVDYIRFLKQTAKDFLEERLIKIYCADCKIMVARFSPVHEHTSYSVSVQCSQCKKSVKLNRRESDRYKGMKDPEWRRQHQAKIVQPFTKEESSFEDEPEEIIFVEPEFVDVVQDEEPGELLIGGTSGTEAEINP